MTVSSNGNTGSTETKVGAGALSNFTENKSNGNFSGGDITFDTSKLGINNPFNTNNSQQPIFNVDDVFTSTVSGNLDIDLPKTNNNNSSSNNITYSNNSKEPTMSVDEVYGKSSSNQPVVEKQGDYATSSNEKSNVETSTFGKQDEVSVTPTSVTENKGMVGNDAIESVEGLDFQQKDKASQEVLDSKKKRDEVEAEDKANQTRDSLKAKTDQVADEDAINKFQIGNDDIDRAASKNIQAAKDKAGELQAKADEIKNSYDIVNKQVETLKTKSETTEEAFTKAKDSVLIGHKWADSEDAYNRDPTKYEGFVSEDKELYQYRGTDTAFESKVKVANEAYADWEATVGEYKQKANYVNKLASQYAEAQKEADKYTANLESKLNDIQTYANKLRDSVARIQQEYKDGTLDANKAMLQLQQLGLMAGYGDFGFSTSDLVYLAGGLDGKYLASNPSALQASYVGAEEAPAVTPESKAITSENAVSETKQTFDNVIQNAVEKGADEKTVQTMTDIATSIDEAQTSMKQAIEQNDIPAYIDAQKQYNKNLNEALQIGNRLTQTDFNKDFVAAVSKANDFTVTLADGTQTTYSQFATDMATKSPEVAKAMYEAKAQKYEAENHPVLAKIERAKAAMVDTWLGSKLTQADNQVRGQFNQMAKTNMRATYAAYNNVLNDANATPEQKAEASAAINQANSLMTASAALQASTGFLSGIGDSMKDGVYGVTDPAALNAYQKTLNTIDNFAKITLGLGVTPGANKAYQNMYYMAGAKVSESGLFSRDFDSDGFALCQEYGNNAAAGMIAGAGELATGIALFFNPAMSGIGLNLVIDSIQTFTNGLYGVQKDARKSEKYTQEVLSYFKEAESIAKDSGNEEAVQEITNAITQIENFELKADEVGNLDNWLEGSGSNTASNEKFNQSLTYDEWLKLIEADPTMREFAKTLTEKKKDKNAQKDNADAGVNS